jgi:hypothetical protein
MKLDPKSCDLIVSRLRIIWKELFEDRTRVCCKILSRLTISGEMPSEHEYSWFSAKVI